MKKVEEKASENGSTTATTENKVLTLNEKIEFFRRKQELINRLENLKTSQETICKQIEEMQNETEADVFSSENFALKFVKTRYSSDTDVFRFKNPVIIADVLNFMIDKINLNIVNIENEINA